MSYFLLTNGDLWHDICIGVITSSVRQSKFAKDHKILISLQLPLRSYTLYRASLLAKAVPGFTGQLALD